MTNKELLRMLDELENARDEEELLTSYQKICEDADKKLGKYEGAFEMYKLTVNAVIKNVDIANNDLKRGNKYAINYVNANEQVKKQADILLKELKEPAREACEIADKATKIKNEKLKRIRISE